MSTPSVIAARVSQEVKAQFAHLAKRQEISESALLKRLIDVALLGVTDATDSARAMPVEPIQRPARLYVRLRLEDHTLLHERARGRGIAAATYASILIRAHLRGLIPLPERELAEVKRAVASLGMVGRNLNQIARIANQTGKIEGLSVADLLTLMRALEGLRGHIKELIRVNSESWETGNVEASRR
jgi:GNAT superfamily N-acetyltransferase